MSATGGISRSRQVELLKLVPPQVERLRNARVFLVHDPRAQSQVGIAKATLANVCQSLARYGERTDFEAFLARLDLLDSVTSQNFNNPSAQHRALKGQLQKFLKDNPDLQTDELLFVLSWVRRFLDDEAQDLDPKNRDIVQWKPVQESGPTEMELRMKQAEEKAERQRRNR